MCQMFDKFTNNAIQLSRNHSLANIYLYKAINGNSSTTHEICSNLTIKTPEQRQRRCFGDIIVNFEQTLHIILMFPLITLNK